MWPQSRTYSSCTFHWQCRMRLIQIRQFPPWKSTSSRNTPAMPIHSYMRTNLFYICYNYCRSERYFSVKFRATTNKRILPLPGTSIWISMTRVGASSALRGGFYSTHCSCMIRFRSPWQHEASSIFRCQATKDTACTLCRVSLMGFSLLLWDWYGMVVPSWVYWREFALFVLSGPVG